MMKFVFIAAVLFLAFSFNSFVGISITAFALIYIIVSNRAFFYARKGNVLINDKKYDEALIQYRKAYKTGSASLTISLTYAILLMRQGDPSEALTVFNLIIMNKKAKDDVKNKAKQYRALAYHKLGQTEDALEEAEEIFDTFKNTVSYGLICYLKLVTGASTEETLNLCKEAYDYNSDDRDIVDNLAYAYILNGEYKEAEKLVNEMLEKFPTFVEAHYHGALLYQKTGDNKKAVELLDSIEDCTRTYMTTVSVEEIEELKKRLNN